MRAKDKIAELQNYLTELAEFMPKDFKEYLKDVKTKAACERYFEKIIEAAVDLAFIIIKDKGLKVPEDDKESFDVLANDKMITPDLASRLKDAKGMRNIIAHQYGTVDDEMVFHSITEELVKDVSEFISLCKKNIREKK
jgi:uncharacterized protein YutE (UPF0331/DUF86 family)